MSVPQRDLGIKSRETVMGLDAVELVIEIEEAFSIKIPDDQASRILTVGDLHQLLISQIQATNTSTVCLSAVTFYILRRAAHSLGVMERLRPRDLTSRLLPLTNRRDFWQRLQSAAELRLPRLCRPQWLSATATCAVILVAVSLAVLSYQRTGSQLAMLGVGMATLTGLGLLAALATQPSAVHPAQNFQTLRGLTETTLGLNFPVLRERYGNHPTDIWVVLRAIIAEQLNVPLEKITPDTSFVNDLGLD